MRIPPHLAHLTLIACIAAPCVAGPGGAPGPEVLPHERYCREIELPNGLTVASFLRPHWQHSRIEMWIHAGSANEGASSGYGVAHFVEHALFSGTRRAEAAGKWKRRGYGYEGIAREIHRLGGREWATSNEDYVIARFQLPAEHAVRGIELMEAFVLRPSFPEGQLLGENGELQVVLTEERMCLSHPSRQRFEASKRLLWGETGYGAPGLGHPELLRRLRLDRLIAFHRAYFVPQNMTLVVIGPTPHRQVEAAARAAFVGPDAAHPIHPRGDDRPLEIHGELPALGRTMLLPWDKQVAEGALVYRIRSPSSRESAASRVIEDVWNSALAAQGNGTRPSVSLDSFKHGSAFYLKSTAQDGPSLAAALRRAENDLLSMTVSKETVETTRRRLLDRMEQSWRHERGISRNLGATPRPGGALEHYRSRYAALRAVTRDQVVGFAREFLRADNRVLVAHAPRAASTSTRGRGAAKREDWTLPNGVRVSVAHDESVARITADLAFPVKAHEAPSLPGLAERGMALHFDGDHVHLRLFWKPGDPSPITMLGRVLSGLRSQASIRPARGRPGPVSPILQASGLLLARPSDVPAPVLFSRRFGVGVCGSIGEPAVLMEQISSQLAELTFGSDSQDSVVEDSPEDRKSPVQKVVEADTPGGLPSVMWFYALPVDWAGDRLGFEALTQVLERSVEARVRGEMGLAYRATAYLDVEKRCLVIESQVNEAERVDSVHSVFKEIVERLGRAGLSDGECQAFLESTRIPNRDMSVGFMEVAARLASEAISKHTHVVSSASTRRLAREWLAPRLAFKLTVMPGK